MWSVAEKKKYKVLAAAIDIGTTYSGYAFSFKDEYNNDPTRVSTNQFWSSGSMSIMSLKAPTCVLFNENKEFHNFGYDAENAYAKLAFDDDFENCYFFKCFTTSLQETKVHRDTEIEDETGKKMLAMTVFGEVIKYLKGHLLELLKQRGTEVVNADIHWVLNVPAIWSDAAKQFMREAAYEAGIDGAQLSIVTNPVLAFLYCQVLPSSEYLSTNAKFQVDTGSKYMVIDLGGRTADFTVLEVQIDGGVRELHKATGGPWGGTKIDEEFNQLLIKLIGAPIYKKFCAKHKADQLDLQRELETKKRTIKPSLTGKINLKVPVALAILYKAETGEEVSEAVNSSKYKGKIQWLSDKMRLDAEVFKGLFKLCIKNITGHILKLLKEPEVTGTNIFLMVGGFSESVMIQDAIMKALPNGKVVIPDEAGLTVLKGAVVFGHKPVAITSRVSKYTYGVNMSPLFDSDIHPDDHKVKVGNVKRCRNVFKHYIQKESTMRVGDPVLGKHISLKPGQEEMLLKIFVSPRRDPKFTDEEDCEHIGTLVVKLPKVDDRVRVEVSMVFGETELVIEAVELHHHTKTTAYFQFL